MYEKKLKGIKTKGRKAHHKSVRLPVFIIEV